MVAEVADAGDGVLGHDDAVRDVGPEVRLEVGDEGQGGEVDLVAERDLVEHRPGLDLAHRPGLPGALAGRPRAARPGSAPSQRAILGREANRFVTSGRRGRRRRCTTRPAPLAACRQLPHQRGDVLVGRDPLLDDQHVLGVLPAVLRQAVVEVLRP